MEYALEIDGTPETVSGGCGILLVHPSTVETDRYDTAFLRSDGDQLLVISTRTTAREVKQKLDHYGVDRDRVSILDTLSVERGYTRRKSDAVTYLASPDDLEGIVDHVRTFLAETEGGRRISLDSVTELVYYADESQVQETMGALLALLDEHDAVGLFHVAKGVHDEELLTDFHDLFDAVIELDEDGGARTDF